MRELLILESGRGKLNTMEPEHAPVRSFEQVAELKRAVDDALARKAHQLQQAQLKTTSLSRANT